MTGDGGRTDRVSTGSTVAGDGEGLTGSPQGQLWWVTGEGLTGSPQGQL